MLDIISVGHTNIDLFVRSNHVVSTEPIQKFGGSASNFAINCSRLGLNVGFAGVVGDDEFGRMILRNFRNERVKFLGTISRKQTGFVIVFSKGSYKRFIKYLGANNLLKDLAVKEEARHYHFATPPIEILSRMEGSVSLDPGASLSRYSFSKLKPYLKKVSVFLPNREEAEKITGKNYRESAEMFLKAGVKVVVIKLGKKGCYAVSGEEKVRMKSKPAKVVDTTGAGDAFDSAFIAAWLKGNSLEECCRQGINYSAKCVSHLGAT